ncbi:MAG: type II secretion system F family protein [Candidatus Omnitrophota bacterium]
MATFKYRAKEKQGQTIEGWIEAATEEEAVEKVSRLGHIPMRVEQTAAEKEKEKEDTASAVSFAERMKSKSGVSLGRKIKGKEITAFGRQLSSLIRSGVPILRAIGIISEQSENPVFKKMLDQIYDDVKNGAPFSKSLGKYPAFFPPLYIALVAAGEFSGNLDQSLLRITEYRQKQEEILSRVRSSMIYPALMAFTGAGTIIFMLAFVMPRLLGVFSRLGGELPLPTRILIQVSEWVRNPWVWGIAIVGTILVILRLRKKNAKQSVAMSRFILGLPVFGTFTLKIQIARFTRTLELLIKSGIAIIEAIQTAAPVVSSPALRDELLKCLKDIKEGGSFGKSLKKSKSFPNFITNLLSVGEESGKLDEALGEIANFYERESDEATRIITSLMEPLMILGMGLVVGFIVIAMLLPMFEINMMVK